MLNFLPQTSQQNGFSPVCVLVWRIIEERQWPEYSQTVHLNGLMLEWTLKWVFKLVTWFDA